IGRMGLLLLGGGVLAAQVLAPDPHGEVFVLLPRSGLLDGDFTLEALGDLHVQGHRLGVPVDFVLYPRPPLL
ncbi:hypothetical protein PCS70012_02338, partial [Streptococcus pneumoniae PCS70012]